MPRRRSILLVDEVTTAEGLYVGMTPGRASNMALAVCEEADAEHHPPGPAQSETEVVLAAMGRSAGEVAALEALREALARSESLATLAPRLANVNAWVATETPPDRSQELQWATDGLQRLTRAGREDRRRLEAVEARYAAVSHKRDAAKSGGPIPDEKSEAIRLWSSMASRIEAYREE